MAKSAERQQDVLKQVAQALVELPDPEEKVTKRQLVALLAGEIEKARNKGHSLRVIAEQFQKNGLEISYGTLRNVLPQQRKRRTASKARKNLAAANTPQEIADGQSNDAAKTADSPEKSDFPPPDVPNKPLPKPAVPPPPVFPPGATFIPLPDGRFIPAPDSDAL